MRNIEELYLAVLNDFVGGSGRVYEITDRGEVLPVLAVAYDNVPEDGHTTGFTFGLSSMDHSEWTHSKPELMISVKSRDHAWVLCMGEIVRNYRHESLFSYGTILHFRQRIADDSSMTSFLVFATSLLDASQQTCYASPPRLPRFLSPIVSAR